MTRAHPSVCAALGMVGAVSCAAACTPTGPPMARKDTGFRLLLDSALPDEDPCRPTLDPATEFLQVAQQVDGPGPYFVCPSVPVTATGDGVRLYVAEFAAATVMGDETISWARSGAQVHASGARSLIVAEEQALVSVAVASSGIERCAEIVWSETWTAGCSAR